LPLIFSGSCGLPGVSGVLPRIGETCRTFWSYAHRQAEVRQLLQGEIYYFLNIKNTILSAEISLEFRVFSRS
jgi:hypothetical protein